MGWVTTQAPSKADLSACVDCGLCLPHCPTYRLTGDEAASPRGRIAAMRAVAEDRVSIDETFEELMSFCLQCRACEAACPSLVPFGRVMEGARAELATQRPDLARAFRYSMVGRLVESPRLLRLVTRALRVAQRSIRSIPTPLSSIAAGLRRLPQSQPATRGTGYQSPAGEMGAAALLSGCVMDPWFGPVHEASIELLTRAGYRVVIPAGQTCCGALSAHDGDARRARRLAARNVRAFRRADLVVADAAGCSAHMKEYSEWAGDGGTIVAERVRDVTEVIALAIDEGRLPMLSEDRGAVAVQDPCHLRNAQRIVDAPRRIVAAAGYRPVELVDDLCCGAAGLYAMLRPETSHELGEMKAAQIRLTGSTVVASANPGCEMQLRAHLESWYRVVHPVELYWEALRETQNGSSGAISQPG